MAPDQLPLDFTTVQPQAEAPNTRAGQVLDISVARRVKQQTELTGVYRVICDSVRHVRLDRAAGMEDEA